MSYASDVGRNHTLRIFCSEADKQSTDLLNKPGHQSTNSLSNSGLILVKDLSSTAWGGVGRPAPGEHPMHGVPRRPHAQRALKLSPPPPLMTKYTEARLNRKLVPNCPTHRSHRPLGAWRRSTPISVPTSHSNPHGYRH